MINQQLLDYMKQQLQQGVDKEQIKSGLLTNGWSETDINEAFVSIDSSNSPSSLENAPTQPLSTFPQQPERRINKILLAVISIVGVSIIGSGVFGYFYYFQETPEKNIKKMYTHLTEVKTLEYQGEIKAEITARNSLGDGNFMQSSDFSINFSGKSDVSDLNNPKATFVFNIRTDALKELIQGGSTFGLEARTIGQVAYLKLNNIPELNNIPDLGYFDLSFLINQWIKIDTEAIKTRFGLEKFEEQIKEIEKQQELTLEQQEKLKQIIAQAKVIKITDKLPSEKIEGIDTHHYRFAIDIEALKKLVVDIMAVVHKETLTEKELRLAGLDTEFGEDLEDIESIGGEIWIGKKDFLPYKISLTMSFKETAESEIAGNLIATLLFKNYNKPMQIDIPSPVKGIEEVLDELFDRFFGGMQLPELQPDL